MFRSPEGARRLKELESLAGGRHSVERGPVNFRVNHTGYYGRVAERLVPGLLSSKILQTAPCLFNILLVILDLHK